MRKGPGGPDRNPPTPRVETPPPENTFKTYLDGRISTVNTQIAEKRQHGAWRAWNTYRRSSGIRVATGVLSGLLAAGLPGVGNAALLLRVIPSTFSVASALDEKMLAKMEKEAMEMAESFSKDEQGKFIFRNQASGAWLIEPKKLIKVFSLLSHVASAKGLEICVEEERSKKKQNEKVELSKYSKLYESTRKVYAKLPLWKKLGLSVAALGVGVGGAHLGLPGLAISGAINITMGALRTKEIAHTKHYEHSDLVKAVRDEIVNLYSNPPEGADGLTFLDLCNDLKAETKEALNRNRDWVILGGLSMFTVGTFSAMFHESLRHNDQAKHLAPAKPESVDPGSAGPPEPPAPAQAPNPISQPPVAGTSPLNTVQGGTFWLTNPNDAGKDLQLAKEALQSIKVYDSMNTHDRMALEEYLAKQWRDAGIFNQNGSLNLDHQHDLAQKINVERDVRQAFRDYKAGNIGNIKSLFHQALDDHAPGYDTVAKEQLHHVGASLDLPQAAHEHHNVVAASIYPDQHLHDQPISSGVEAPVPHGAVNTDLDHARQAFANAKIPSLSKDQIYTLITEKTPITGNLKHVPQQASEAILRHMREKHLNPEDIKIIPNGHGGQQLELRVHTDGGGVKFEAYKLEDKFQVPKLGWWDRWQRATGLEKLLKPSQAIGAEHVNSAHVSVAPNNTGGGDTGIGQESYQVNDGSAHHQAIHPGDTAPDPQGDPVNGLTDSEPKIDAPQVGHLPAGGPINPGVDLMEDHQSIASMGADGTVEFHDSGPSVPLSAPETPPADINPEELATQDSEYMPK